MPIRFDLFGDIHEIPPGILSNSFIETFNSFKWQLNNKMYHLINQIRDAPPERLQVLELASPELIFEALMHVPFGFEETDTVLDEFIRFLELVLDYPATLNDQETEH
jgi:hypothetical protein